MPELERFNCASEHMSPSPNSHFTPGDADDYRRSSNGSSMSNWNFSSSPQHIRVTSPIRDRDERPSARRGPSNRSMSEALRFARSAEEQETLLGEEEVADDDGCYPPRKTDDPIATNPHASCPVYMTIHRIRRLIIASIGT